MKQLLNISLLAVFFFSTVSFAHKEWVHQHIVYEAYRLLKMYYNMEVPEIESNLGSYGSGTAPWVHGEILKGAYREDLEDPVTGVGGGIMGWNNGWTASSTHFWDVDQGDFQETDINVGVINAYHKAYKYIYGGWRLHYQNYVYTYNSLIDLYVSGNVHWVGWVNELGELESRDQWFIASPELRRLLVWEILGRVCHLLADMSVPAHVHIDTHPCELGDEDNYEVDISSAGNGVFNCNEQTTFPGAYTNYTAETAFNSGNFIDPYNYDQNNPIRYLFYYSAQVAGHFASQNAGGNNDVNNNPYPGVQDYINSLGPAIPSGQVNVVETANILMNLTIKATASLFYWFAKEADLMKSITITSSKLDDFVQVRNPARSINQNSQYYWQPTPYTLKFDNSITLDLMADPWANGYEFQGWQKRDRNNINIGYNSQLEWLDVNATATSTFVANYAPLVTVSFDPIQIESSSVNAYYKNLTTGEISSSFTFPIGYPITIEAVAPPDYTFLGWKDSGGFISGSNPASFNPSSNLSGIYATFKKIGASDNLDAYSNNSQRKFVRNYSNVLFSVYSSMEKVWIEYSTNNGLTWQLGNDKRPLFEGLDAKNPSIEIWNTGFEYIETKLLVTAQVNVNGQADIQISRLTWNPSHYIFQEWNHIPLSEVVYWPYSYTETNLEPVLGMIHPDGKLLVAIDLTELGNAIDFWAGTLIGNSSIEWFDADFIISQYQISNVSICSIKLDFDISQSDLYDCWIAYEEKTGPSSSKIMVTRAYMSSNSNFSFTNPVEVSQNNGFIKNYRPSITAWLEGETNQCVAVTWIAYRSAYTDDPLPSGGETKVFLKSYSNGVWSPGFNTYGNNINTVNVNKNNNNSYAFAWSEGSNNINRFVKSNNLTIVNIANTYGKYLQVGNFANFNSMRLNSFKTSTTPYSFQLSNVFNNDQNEEELYADRSGLIVQDTTSFYFAFGNINVNDEMVGFIEIPDSITIDNKDNLNTYLISEPFNLTDNANFIYGIQFGVTDSISAALTLNEGKSVQFTVQLIDDQTNEVISTLDDIVFNSGNIIPYESIAYQVNTSGIGNRTCRLKLTADDNLGFDYSLVDSYNSETTLSKKSFVAKFLNGNENVGSYTLAQNFPNPFNPTTSIHYQLPEDGLVTLRIYDILGSVVKTLVNEEKLAGKYEINFNASSLASGVYIYRLNVNDFVDVKKMILLK
jgi:hypothetical protein